jgi:hypothetical protein
MSAGNRRGILAAGFAFDPNTAGAGQEEGRRFTSRLFDQPIVFRMGTDPEPNHGIALFKPDCSPSNSNANRVDRRLFSNKFEIEPGCRGLAFQTL